MLLATRNFAVSPWAGLQREMDRMFNGFADASGGTTNARAFPALSIWEDGKAYYVEAEVPGMSLDKIEIVITGDELRFKGQRDATDHEGATYHRRERVAGTFERVLRLPTEVETGKVEATLKDGVLTIVLPKAEAARARTVAVKSA